MTSSFKALRIHEDGKTTRAQFDTLTLDDLNAGEVVIRVAYSCINFKDALAVTGKGKIMRDFPKVAGIDLSGTVESSEDANYKAGDKVLVTGCNLGETLDGGLAEYARVPASAVIPLPPGLSLQEAMAIGTAGFTAALGIKRMLENHQTPENGPIAVTGPTGGVGSVAVSIFNKLGFEVHAISGKANSQAEYLKSLGAAEIVDRNALEMSGRPLAKAQWGGALDNLGGPTLAWLASTTRQWGTIASIGLAQSAKLETTVMPLILRGVSLLGINSVEVPRAWREDVWQKLSGEWKPATLSAIAPRTVSLDEVPPACAQLIEGSQHGRTVVQLAGG